jgi:hypothetical protein
VCLASAAYQFFFAATMTAYLVFLPRELHLSGTAVGLALAATGPGALVGSLLAYANNLHTGTATHWRSSVLTWFKKSASA